jgi:Zn-dependent peptidase ImmA (M78 family)
MAVDELSIVLKARSLINKVSPDTIPVPIEAYVQHVGAVLHFDRELGPDEPGWCFQKDGKHHICVNAKDREERQRFTACHELAHIVLGLPSKHVELPWWSYAKR